jgi:uroporphyrinogen decarboxylase
MPRLSKRERVLATLAGAKPDRVPISLWGHFPSDPHRAEDLAAETLRFQSQFDWDFVKLMPSGMYYPEALCCTVSPASGPGAVNGLAESVIKAPADWGRLPVLDPRRGWLAEHIQSIRLVREALGPNILIIESLFSPLTVAHKMSLHVPFGESVGQHRDALEVGLAAITTGTIRFAEAALEAGADGFFFATQEANHPTLGADDFAALGRPYDLEILGSVAGHSAFTLLHVCQTGIYANLVADYPVHAINWDSCSGQPSLADARSVWRQTLVGGLDRDGALLNGSPADVASSVRRSIAEVGPRRFVVGPTCALRVATPVANLLAARAAVERHD